MKNTAPKITEDIPPPANRKGWAFGAFLVAATLLALAPPEQARAQLLLTVNPLQGDANQTVWTFSGSSTANQAGSIPIISGSAGFGSYGYLANYGAPASGVVNVNDQLILSGRQPALAGDYALSSANVNFRPQITISTNTRPISHITLINSTGADSVGIRVSGSPLSYTTNNPVSWRGRGVLPYSITNLTATASGEYFYNFETSPYFAATGTRGTPTSSGFRMVVSSTPIVPEPEEYALVFALFALGFVIVRRHFQRKQKRQQTQAAAIGS